MCQTLQLALLAFLASFYFCGGQLLPVNFGMCYLMGPTYGTIDNKYWSFNQGVCKPLVAKPCNPAQLVAAGGPKDFELSVDSYFTYDEYYAGLNVLFNNYGKQYTIRNLMFVAYGQKILIGWDQAKVNGKVVTLPWYYPNKENPDIWITGSNSAVASYMSGKTLGTRFGVNIYIYGCPVAWLEGNAFRGLKNNMCGMCGTWNGNQTDDFTLPDGTITKSGLEMIKQWTPKKLRGKCNSVKVGKCPPGQMKQAETICKVLLDRNGPLKPCYSSTSRVSSWYPRYVKMHYERCIELACQNKGKDLKAVACSKINEMTSICQLFNRRREPIEPIDECAPKCSKASSKPACINTACRNSCEHPTASSSSACRYNRMPCIPGCECKAGYTYNGKRDACVKRC